MASRKIIILVFCILGFAAALAAIASLVSEMVTSKKYFSEPQLAAAIQRINNLQYEKGQDAETIQFSKAELGCIRQYLFKRMRDVQHARLLLLCLCGALTLLSAGVLATQFTRDKLKNRP